MMATNVPWQSRSKSGGRLKGIASLTIENFQSELNDLSSKIWKNPELGYEEYKAHDLLTSFLEKKGFTVERSFTGINTAFKATFGSGSPNICVLCEYDALPGIGHACGHNLIAEAGVATGLGLKAVLESSEAPHGRVTVMGSPDEEVGGGKVALIENGAFEDVDIAMMVHPAPYSVLKPQFVARTDRQATFTGKAAHAAAFPWKGMNALDATVMAYNSISVLRQQTKPTYSIHGIISKGGTKPNIIPEVAQLQYIIRATNASETLAFAKRIEACFESAAVATGCKVDIVSISKPNDDLQSNETLARLYNDNSLDLGLILNETLLEIGSTDMGNVSYTVPSIHPMYKIGRGEKYHTREFTDVTNTPEAHRETLVAAKAMAHTCIDVLTTDGLLEEIKSSFETQMNLQ